MAEQARAVRSLCDRCILHMPWQPASERGLRAAFGERSLPDGASFKDGVRTAAGGHARRREPASAGRRVQSARRPVSASSVGGQCTAAGQRNLGGDAAFTDGERRRCGSATWARQPDVPSWLHPHRNYSFPPNAKTTISSWLIASVDVVFL